MLRTAVKVLNSSSQSAEKIRLMLDDLIKVSKCIWQRRPLTDTRSLRLQARYGPSKMLINTLNKKYLAEEQPPLPPPIVTSSSSSAASGSDDSNSMEVAYDHTSNILVSGESMAKELGTGTAATLEENSLKDLEELFCLICGEVHTSIRNQLVECSDCHLLYHQDCHKPAISDADAATSDWQCSKCRSLPIESILTSSSSTSSSPTVFATKTSSSSSPHSSSSSSKSSKGGGGSGGGGTGTSSGMMTADKRLANMKKKAAKMQKTK